MTEISHLYNLEEETPLYLLIDLSGNKKMSVHNKETLLMEDLTLGEGGWVCTSSFPNNKIDTINDIFELCDQYKRSEMIPNKSYPIDFVNVSLELGLRRIL